MREDSFFDIFPDMDADGDHDIVDFFILDEIDNEMQREIEERDSKTSFADSDDEDDEIFLEYDIDRDDYPTKEDYLEAVDEAKYGWRDAVEDGSEYDIDPEDYETLEEYECALEEARWLEGDTEDGAYDVTEEIDLPLSFSIEVSCPRNEQLEEIKEEDYPNERTYDAAYALCEIEHGDPYIPAGTTKEAEAARHRFVLSQSCVAARYLTMYDGFIFVQAIKDYFRLPIDVPDEDKEVKNYFPDFFMELAEEDVNLAIDIWAWCIKEFGIYQEYMESTWTLYNGIFYSISDYPEAFTDLLIDRLGHDKDFRNGLLSECPDTPYQIPELTIRALMTNRETIAQDIFLAAMKNPKAKSKWKQDTLERMISECSNWEELETMESFQKYILPIAEMLDDKRIQRVLPKMICKVDEYIRYVESSSDKYRFSRRFAWRSAYTDESKYPLNPIKYETEQEYLSALQERKYSWRKNCNKRFGVSPDDYETRQEYEGAVRIAIERETQIMRELRDSEPVDTVVYKFCKVSLDYPYRPYYYYLVGDLQLTIGDNVTVPFGSKNELKDAVVMSVGECAACTFPCKLASIKYVKSKSDAKV